MTKIYFASPLFSEMELAFNKVLVEKIRHQFPGVEVYLPQEQMAINDKSSYADSTMIAQYDTDALLDSDLMIAVLDGAVIDVGVASEIGVAYHADMPILGLYTDSRQQGADNPQKIAALQEVAESQFSYVNLYTVGLVKLRGEIVSSSDELLEAPSSGSYLQPAPHSAEPRHFPVGNRAGAATHRSSPATTSHRPLPRGCSGGYQDC